MFFHESPGAPALAALAGARRECYWLDRPGRPLPQPALAGDAQADLLVVGAGFTGLWTALLAKQADPGRDVLLVEGGRVADGATGRNGGFVAASLTHGIANGMSRWPGQMRTLQRLGHENLDEIAATVDTYGIDCDFVRTGEFDVAVEPYQVEAVRDEVQAAHEVGDLEVRFLDTAQIQAAVKSPVLLAAAHDARGVALTDPARLAWGLRDACLAEGVRVAERTPVLGLRADGGGIEARTRTGLVRATRVALATNAYPPLLRRLRHYVVPVYDYALMTEPLTDAQWSSVGWSGREGIGGSGNQFHYYRTTDDGRILFGGYDAVYEGGFSPRHDHREETYGRLAEHFFQVFPQLAGLRFSNAWGGAIDTCSRFSAFWGTAMAGRVGYVAGYTGLGVGASRFGAATMLDLLDGRSTERTELEMVRSKPLPFPPEPVRGLGISLTTASIRRADANEGRRDLWLRTLDRLGMGFDS